jgi:uncharacterized protein involved in exopolysaccharide biosynthesis
VKQNDAMLNVLKKERESILKRIQETPAEVRTVMPAANSSVLAQRQKDVRALENRIQDLQISLQQRDMQTASSLQEITELERRSKTLQKTLETTPLGDDEFQKLVRDRDFAKRRYDETNQKVAVSETGTELEERSQSATLAVLDNAYLPDKPTDPKRSLIVGIGAILGLALGIVIAVAREMKDTSLKNLKDVRAYTQLTVLGSVPLLENDLVVRRRRRLAWLAWSTGCLLAILIMSGSVYYYFSTKV